MNNNNTTTAEARQARKKKIGGKAMRYGGKGPLPRRFCARCLEVADCYRSLLVAIVLVLVVYRIRSLCPVYEGRQW